MEEAKSCLRADNDYVFHRLMENPKNKNILKEFLKAAIDLPNEALDELRILDYREAGYKSDIYPILCVKFKLKTGKYMEAEIQISALPTNGKIITAHSMEMTANRLEKSDSMNLEKIANIAIVKNNIVDDEFCTHRFCWCDIENEVSSDFLKICLLELEKTPTKSKDEELYDWLRFLNCKTDKDFEKLLEETQNEAIRDAVLKLKELSQDDEVRFMAEARDKEITDKEFCIKRSRAEGRTAGILQSAKKMLEAGMTVEKVAEILELSKEDVEELK